MTSQTTPPEHDTAAHQPGEAPARRRMAGYTPLQPPRQEGGQDPVPDVNTSIPAAGSAGAALDHDPTGTAAPVHRTRMSEIPAPSGAVPTASEDAPTHRARMGGTPQVKQPPQPGLAVPGAGQPAWVKPVVILSALVLVGLAMVLGARWLRTLNPVVEFIITYDGHASQPETVPTSIPAWLGWQHFLNMFFLVLIIRTGLQVRTERKPPGYWTAEPDSFFSPKGNTPKKVSLTQWLHQSLDVLWMVNGAIFIVLLFITGHWMRIMPTSWDVLPNMVSAGLQYASLDWPAENGWAHYNALQVAAYFTTVFLAAPLAIATGLRLSTWWPEKVGWLNKAYPVELARAVHFPVMLYFVAFTIVHVFLVSFTGVLRNLNHMYTSRDTVDAWGLIIFLTSLVVITAAWFLTKPLFTTPIATRMGKVTK